jgi:hypothetical protein
MLVCNVSQRARRAAIAVDIAEAAIAADAAMTGNVVFATLVDDPASVGDHVDAFLGQIMREVANAAAMVDAGMTYAAAVREDALATATHSAILAASSVITESAAAMDLVDVRPSVTFNFEMLESAAANSIQDAELPVASAAKTAVVSGLQPIFANATLLGTHRLRSGTAIYSAYIPLDYGSSVFEAATASETFSAEGGTELVGPGISDLSADNQFTGILYHDYPYHAFTIAATGTWSGTLSLEYSISGPSGPWSLSETRTANFSGYWSIPWYPRWIRVGFEPGGHISGTAHVQLKYA